MKNIKYLLPMLLLLTSCRNEEKKKEEKNATPTVSNSGQEISFQDTAAITFFKTEKVNDNSVNADLAAIGNVGAIIVSSNTGASQNIILFEKPELASNYTQLIQHQANIRQIQNINIRQKQIELERTKDLQQHGSATGQDLLNAQAALSMEQTSLANEKAALIEHEAKLKSGGFNPELLRNAKAGAAYIICDIPENQISKINEGSSCSISFSSFPNETYTGKVENIADVVDNATRMVKIRIRVNNSTSKIKAGMFANISFGLNEGNFVTISKTSLATVQGKNYVFAKKSAHEFERREIQTGQQIGNRIVVFKGLNNGDEIAIEGVMQLKGLSFGY
ncbi:efflux RND transporter periplasmic adaptor subunit [Flavobacterium microcysteis]|uniref:Efflux RND transporter periplasmic adaptor subunit n=1 Tax=Flavobacterium microcysteis TaxID=2596891 RepID=A0A501PZB7_9FLAO|nr:efflux RND transporter periplasmic adaptor subunit [Flavobacterium microcysteis]TPD65392.1 efflux RND transporter periplasmic adaptor subunit [Flavobacterium microcysteis]